MASPPPSWVILDVVPSVSAAAGAQAAGTISLALAAPPRVTRFTVGPRVFPTDPDTKAMVLLPFLLAHDPSGLLLAIAPPSKSERTPDESPVSRSLGWIDFTRIPTPAYLVLDVRSGTASRLPDPNIRYSSSVGVIAAPGRGGGCYMVVEFQNTIDDRTANLICFSSVTNKWVTKEVANPLPGWMWSFYDVIAHDGKLWWVDLAAGLLACDPFADDPKVVYVPLPTGATCPPDEHDRPDRSCMYCADRMDPSRHCVKLSNGKLRYVEMGYANKGEAPTLMLSMRTLADPVVTAEWTVEYQVSFDEIWADDSYKAAGLPEEEPVIALIHPTNPDVIYFFLKEYIFGVDMPARKVVERAAHELPSKRSASSSSVLAWELPPTLTAVVRRSAYEIAPDNGVKEESEIEKSS